MAFFRKPHLQRQRANAGKEPPRISMMGMAGVGKTTIWGAVTKYAQMQTSWNKSFFMDINAAPGHPILLANSYVSRCRYPPKTDEKKAYTAEIWLKWTRLGPLPASEAKIVVVETSGERVRAIVDSYAIGFGLQQTLGGFSSDDTESIEEYILKSRDFILVADLSQSHMYSQSNAYTGDGEIQDPDMECRDIIQSIQRYKRDIVGDPTEPRFCVLLAKYDLVRLEFETNGMNLRTDTGLEKFLAQGFSFTANKLSYTQNPKNLFLPVWVEGVRGDPDHIMRDPKTRLPFMSDSSFAKLLNWIRAVV